MSDRLTDEQEREAFEAWLIKHQRALGYGRYLSDAEMIVRDDKTGRYHPFEFEKAWEAWQAHAASTPKAAPSATSEHLDEIEATLRGAHAIMETLSSQERKIGPLGSHGRGYTHKITKALQHLESLRAALSASTPKAEPVPPTEQPVKWWNGIRRPDLRDGTGPSFSDTENTSHDIPLYAGVNPCNVPAAPAPKTEPVAWIEPSHLEEIWRMAARSGYAMTLVACTEQNTPGKVPLYLGQPLSDAAPAETWQPIETAPADGRCLLAIETDEGYEFGVLTRDSRGNWVHEGEPTFCHSYYFKPTHWQPLPPPPALASQEAPK